MPSEPLRRRHFYSDPRDTTLHPLTDANGVQIYDTEIRDLPATYLETSINTRQYHEPLQRAHNSGPHGWGIASGLGVKATLNQTSVKVLPGIAIDAAGRHIVLAEGGKAEKGVDASNPQVSPLLVDVLAAGAELPAVGLNGVALNGAFYITIAWAETFNNTLWNDSSQETFEMMHTPWLRFEPVASIPNDLADDGSRIVLGRVQINAGTVTALTHERRREVSLPAGTLQLYRGTSTTTGVGAATTFAADNTRTGEVRARPAGGIEIRVAEPNDQVDFYRNDGTNVPKTISKVSLGADHIVARRSDGRETVRIDSTLGNITLGTQGVEGDVVVMDGSNRRVFVVDGSNASTTIGAAGNEGDIRLMDAAGQVSWRADGATGDLIFRGALRDPAGSHGGIGHAYLRHLPELTGGGNTKLHRHNDLGNATRAVFTDLFINMNGVATADISFQTPRRVTAFASLGLLDPTDSFDRADAVSLEIYRIDGQDYRRSWVFGGDHHGPDGDDANCRIAVFVGTAKTITFRLRSFVNVTAFAHCVAFPEFL